MTRRSAGRPTPAPVSIAADVRDLLARPGAHKHVVAHGRLDGVRIGGAELADRDVVVDAEVESVVEGLLVRGEVRGVAACECARCLEPFQREVRAPVLELFAVRDFRAAEPGYAVLADDRLPLDTLARDALALALPAAPFCAADCAGLCPQCGVNRNDTDCGHLPASGDLRWAPLAALARAGAPGDQRES